MAITNTEFLEPLDRYFNGECTEKDVNWHEIEKKVDETRNKGPQAFADVTEALKPYYWNLIEAHMAFFHHCHAERFAINTIIRLLSGEGNTFCSTYNNINIVRIADIWGNRLLTNNQPPTYFFSLMSTLIEHGYKPNWKHIISMLIKELARLQQYGNFKTAETLCILMGYAQIYESGWADNFTVFFRGQLRAHWDFLRYMYSVSLNYIVGMKYNNFAEVAHAVTRCKSNYPFLHLFYNIFNRNFYELCLEECPSHAYGPKVYDKAEENIEVIENIIKQSEVCGELTVLCEIILPESLKEALTHERPRTYDELEARISDLSNLYDDVTRRVAESVKKEVSMKEIQDAFDKFDKNLAMSFYCSINNLLAQNPTWNKYSPYIQKHILERKEEYVNVSVGANYGTMFGNVSGQTNVVQQLINDNLNK